MPNISNRKDLIVLEGTTIHETDEAVKIAFEGHITEHWIPKQFLEDWPDKGDSGDIIIEEWIAIDKEII